ncbi:MAG: ATP-binding protein, partial [Ktedonobacterales bacterium]
PSDQEQTLLVAPPQPRSNGRIRFRRLRSLRVRLTLTFVGLAVILFLILGLVLNAISARVLYADEQLGVTGESAAIVATQQHTFDAQVNGAVSAACAGAISYQQAFQNTIVHSLKTIHPSIQAVYLLDHTGTVLAPDGTAVPAGSSAPYLDATQLRKLWTQVSQASRRAGTGSIGATSYFSKDPKGQTLGVTLIAERYRTASSCVNPTNGALGVVEIVTTFPRAQAILSTLHLVLLLMLLAIILGGVLIGGPLVSRALSPLTRMTQAARLIARGDLSQRVRLPHSGDEIGQLADSFDEMASRIQTAFAVQQASEERMRQFIADASHELRTPLTSIRGFVDVLLRGAKDDPATAEEVLIATRREAERMSRLVNDLLTLARLDVGRPMELQPVDTIGLVGEAVDQGRILAGEREVSMHTDGAGRLMLMADPDRIKQVLLVLLDNALKYGRQAPSGWVRVEVSRNAGAAIITVTDNGEGIAPEDLPHIFDRFYRAQRAARARRLIETSQRAAVSPRPALPAPTEPAPRPPQKEGSGLGLPIAQGIVRAHGGTLTVRSEVGRGTQFTITLPAHTPIRPA